MLIVTGANGTLGKLVVERLLARVPASQLGVSVREPRQAQALAERGVRVRRGDFEEPASLPHAFEGAAQILIISASATGEVAYRRHRAAIDAAVAAGAERILYTSHMGASLTSRFAPMRAHAQSEELLAACGVAYVSLRNGFYASAALRSLIPALESGTLAVPADGPVSWTAHADLAEAAAITMTTDPFRGISPPLTAGIAQDFADLARVASEVTGVRVERVVLPDDAYRAELAKHMPAERAELLTGMFLASRAGEFAKVDPALAQLLGRRPQTVRDLIVSR